MRASDTHARTASGVMLSSSTMVAPAAIASCTCSARSHSTSTVRPGQRACPRRTASVIPRPARWLSFTSTNSESEPRWFTPPPARTAAFSTARSPGSVLRVSQIRATGPAASTNRRVSEATPDRWHRKLSALRSPVSTDRSGPDTSPTLVPGLTASPSSTSHCTCTSGSSCANTSVGARGARDHAVGARHDVDGRGGVGGDERGGEVTERPDVLGQRARHQRPHDVHRRVELPHAHVGTLMSARSHGSLAASGTNSGVGPPVKTRRPRNSVDGSG